MVAGRQKYINRCASIGPLFAYVIPKLNKTIPGLSNIGEEGLLRPVGKRKYSVNGEKNVKLGD